MTATLTARGDGEWVLTGRLDFASVAQLWPMSRRLFAKQPLQRIDLSGVVYSDSSGIALLVVWRRQAQQRGQTLQFLNVPAQMRAIIQVTALTQLLAVA